MFLLRLFDPPLRGSPGGLLFARLHLYDTPFRGKSQVVRGDDLLPSSKESHAPDGSCDSYYFNRFGLSLIPRI